VGDVRVAHVGPAGETHELRTTGSSVFRNRITEFKR
jgi:hypothetical protein